MSSFACDHDWKFITDSAGDSDVIDGTQSWCYWECRVCGETKDPDQEDWNTYYFEDDMA